MSENREPIRRVAVIVAHPDDPEFSAGGTTAKYVREGVEVVYVLVTSGSKGTEDPQMAGQVLATMREKEQRAAAEKLGVRDVRFLRFPDNELMPNLELRRAITRALREIRPDLVITHDPTTRYGDNFINHPDHRAVGNATLDAIYPAARDPLNYPEFGLEGLEAHKVREVLLSGATQPNYWVDIGDTLGQKVEALIEHKSQIKNPQGLEERMKERSRMMAEGQEMEYAERFRRIVLG